MQNMRKLLLLICLMFNLCINAQVAIPFEVEGNTNYINAKIGDRLIKFVFDTGATSVLLPQSDFQELKSLGKINVIGTSKVKVADGTTHDAYNYNIADINIDGIHIKDISATTIIGQEGCALFGMTAIKKLGDYQMKNGNLILQDYSKLTFDNDFKVSLLGCHFGLDTYEQCFQRLGKRFEIAYHGYDDVWDCKYIYINELEIGEFKFESVELFFKNNVLAFARMDVSEGPLENKQGVKIGKYVRDQVFSFYKQKYKYSKEALDKETFKDLGIAYKYYDLGFTPACKDVRISLIACDITYSIEVCYYYDVKERLRREGEAKKNSKALDDI